MALRDPSTNLTPNPSSGTIKVLFATGSPPVVELVLERFKNILPDLPLVVIPHPVGGLSLEQVEGRALVAIPQVVELINSKMAV